jgi:hypothetical protein
MIGLASFPINTFVEKCDNIILKDGKEISAKVLEVTPDLIKYKKCDNLDGPLFSINKSDVIMIRYSDGTKDIINGNNDSKLERGRFDILGLLALVFAITALLTTIVYSWIFSSVALVLGVIGLLQKNRNKTLSIIGLSFGLLVFILAIIYESY